MHKLLQKIKSSPDINANFEQSFTSQNEECQAISFVNPFSYQQLRSDETSYTNLDGIYSDGSYSTLLFTLFLGKKVGRHSFDFSSFANQFFLRLDQTKAPVYLLGTDKENIEAAVANFKVSYPDLNIVGYQDGYFDDFEQVVSDINESGAEYVVCGLGTPKQDHFAQFVKTRLNKQVKRVYTCGGFLHQSADSFDYYPEWIKKTGMRWLYRVYKEPQKVLGRLLRSYPLFIFSLASDRFK